MFPWGGEPGGPKPSNPDPISDLKSNFLHQTTEIDKHNWKTSFEQEDFKKF